ncbi:hypothetical protein KP509_1Z261800 [Ceratopteris richardii]|nr:hypothetical protein KP509_1Z261800 [Ceratopteris richardii]
MRQSLAAWLSRYITENVSLSLSCSTSSLQVLWIEKFSRELSQTTADVSSLKVERDALGFIDVVVCSCVVCVVFSRPLCLHSSMVIESDQSDTPHTHFKSNSASVHFT